MTLWISEYDRFQHLIFSPQMQSSYRQDFYKLQLYSSISDMEWDDIQNPTFQIRDDWWLLCRLRSFLWWWEEPPLGRAEAGLWSARCPPTSRRKWGGVSPSHWHTDNLLDLWRWVLGGIQVQNVWKLMVPNGIVTLDFGPLIAPVKLTSWTYDCDKVDIIWKYGREEGGLGRWVGRWWWWYEVIIATS